MRKVGPISRSPRSRRGSRAVRRYAAEGENEIRAPSWAQFRSEAGPVVRADAVLYPRGLAPRRAPVQGMARPLYRRRFVFHAAAQERAAPRAGPRSDAARRSGDPRGGPALSRDAGGKARDRHGLG